MDTKIINDIIFILCLVVYLYGVYILIVGNKFDDRKLYLKSLSNGQISKSYKRSATEYILSTTSLNRFKIVNKFSMLLLSQNFKSKATLDLVLCSIIFLVLFGFRIFSVLTFVETITYTAILVAVPIVYLAIRLQNIQSKGSLESEELLSDLLGYYMVTNSFTRAIESCIEGNTKLHLLNKPLIVLLNGLETYRSDAELKACLNRFEQTIGTRWCKKLTYSIYSDVRYGINQTKALESLIKDLEYGRTLFEDSKRFNSETVLLIKYMTPVMYVGSMLTGMYYLDMSISEIIHNQLFDPTGVKMFALILGGMLLNYVMLHNMNNTKLDILG